MKLPRLVIFGEALTDFIRDDTNRWRSVAGGACWNVARVGARLGAPTGFAGAVSTDIFGDEIMQKSAEAGLDMRFTQQVDRPPLLAMVVATRPPKYFFIGENSADLAFDPAALPADWLDTVEIVHFGCLGLAREPLASRLIDIALAVRAAGKRISFDPNFRAPMADPAYRDTLRTMIGISDYIKVSDEDLVGLFPEFDEVAALAQIRTWAPQAAVLVTRGAAGMELFAGNETVVQPGFKVEVADTVGCGDACVGSWMASLLTRPEAAPADHLRFAAACAALVASRAGAYAPTAAEVHALIESANVPASEAQ
ncbi:carbohydrate kinase family protein [Burkholderia sp. IMCC1007]|uniref:carbohydrate kinase family protein n=1 Tax=Burkholderia sp. IMCC1007 TaxID=3004104 RepID=UPI0022B44811|nr:carbohydrate kinase [Burkholderia sp. IMCC1007]